MKILFVFLLIPLFTIPVFAELADFVDPQKDPYDYFNRYYNEPEYKDWFDRNYPDYTIEEAIGLIEPYSEMEEINKQCKITAREILDRSVKSYILSGGSAIGAEYQVGNKSDEYFFRCTETNLDQLNEIGIILADLGHHKEAIEYYDKALAFYSTYANAMTNKALSLFEMGKLEESLLLFEEITKKFPEYEPAKDMVNYLKEQIPYEGDIVCGTGTVLKDGLCVLDLPDTNPSSKGGGCLIATATFGSELAPQVQQLREIRDNSLLQTESGSAFMKSFNQFYYSFSPEIADFERENPVFKEVVKLAITPLLFSLSLLNYVEMDSESEVLGYGISLILLNVGMYFVLPAIVIHRIKNFLNIPHTSL